MAREKRIGRYPYHGCLVFPPFYHEKEGRYYVQIKRDGKYTSTAYARFIFCTHHGKELTRDTEVDHIDGDRTNDMLENLQILDSLTNKRKNALDNGIKKNIVFLKCPDCGKTFAREKRQTFLAKGGVFTACSRSCSGSFRQKLQMANKTGSGMADLQSRIDANVEEELGSRNRGRGDLVEKHLLEDWRQFTDPL